MSNWAEDYYNAEGPAVIRIEADGGGEIRFGFVRGTLDGQVILSDPKSHFRFTWLGTDELEPVQGQGEAWIEDGILRGEINVAGGDRSGFRAMRSSPGPS